MADDLRKEVGDIREKIGAMVATDQALHSRQDKMEIRLKEVMDKIEIQLVELNAHMNRQKGGKAVWALVGTLAVSLIGALAKLLIH